MFVMMRLIFNHGLFLTNKILTMKKIFFLLCVIIAFTSSRISAQDPKLTALLAINESQYINKPLDSIIAVLPSGYTYMKIYGISNTARQVLVAYPNEVWIGLHVREYTIMNPVDSTRVWNLTQMRQEKLFRSVIYQHNTCYRNCDVR